nr:putative vacuolar protein sorting-associated protein Ist1 [Tanacetum cinerariifolium]
LKSYMLTGVSSCYDFVDQSCLLVLTHLSPMSKQRECPDQCKEAVSTLMFAAARFANLPELRELRTLFVKRYGNSIEPYVNPEQVLYKMQVQNEDDEEANRDNKAKKECNGEVFD